MNGLEKKTKKEEFSRARPFSTQVPELLKIVDKRKDETELQPMKEKRVGVSKKRKALIYLPFSEKKNNNTTEIPLFLNRQFLKINMTLQRKKTGRQIF